MPDTWPHYSIPHNRHSKEGHNYYLPQTFEQIIAHFWIFRLSFLSRLLASFNFYLEFKENCSKNY